MMFRRAAALATVLALAFPAAQAARFEVVSGEIAGSTLVSVVAGAQAVDLGGTLIDDSTTSALLGIDAGDQSLALQGGTAGLSWTRLMSLHTDAEGRSVSFLSTSSTALTLTDAGALDHVGESSGATLFASLRVAPDEGETAGSSVRVHLGGRAEALWHSDIEGMSDLVTVDLVARDSTGAVLGSFTGLPVDQGLFSLTFDTRIGEVIEFSLLHAGHAALMSSEITAPGGARGFASSSLIDGTLTVTAVPEPDAVLLVLAGLSLAGVAARRRA